MQYSYFTSRAAFEPHESWGAQTITSAIGDKNSLPYIDVLPLETAPPLFDD